LATIASAAARTSASVTLWAKWFQLFQPMGGVLARRKGPAVCAGSSGTAGEQREGKEHTNRLSTLHKLDILPVR
jgi:hypothetical protein